MNDLEKLMYLRGISAEYVNYSGERVPVAWETRVNLLKQMGVDPSDPAAVSQQVYELDAAQWKSWLTPTAFITLGKSEHIDLHLHPEGIYQWLFWTLHLENGAQQQGSFVAADLPECGDYHLEHTRYSLRRLALP